MKRLPRDRLDVPPSLAHLTALAGRPTTRLLSVLPGPGAPPTTTLARATGHQPRWVDLDQLTEDLAHSTTLETSNVSSVQYDRGSPHGPPFSLFKGLISSCKRKNDSLFSKNVILHLLFLVLYCVLISNRSIVSSLFRFVSKTCMCK